MTTPRNVRNTKTDPLLNFKFLVYWAPGSSDKLTPVAGVSRIGALTRNTESVAHREGGAPQGARQIPGQVAYSPITLERGLIVDLAFEQWANKVWFYENTGKLGQEVSLKDFRKDITIQLLNQAGQAVAQYHVFNCWPSEYQALPDLDASSNEVALETMTLVNEGWQREIPTGKPAELPEFDAP